MKMNWARKVMAGLVFGTVAAHGLAGCSSSDSSKKPSSASIVGKACSADSNCTALSGGYCPDVGVCTRECSMHSDCGCPANITNGDIASGKCANACVDVGSSTDPLPVCLRVCSTGAKCEGSTTCTALTSYSVCY
jgi:hypothetical protein